MIPVYNRTRYLERTLRSVLEQDPGVEEMQIEVVDDASSLGDPEALVRRVGGKRVDFVRQPRRLGGYGNVNSCIGMSLGEWVHILHSDDIVFSGFYARFRAALERKDDVGAAFCRHAYIDENERCLWSSDLERPTPGNLPNIIEQIGVSGVRVQSPAIVVRRSVYEDLGGFRLDIPFCADWEMWKRIAARYPIWYEPETLAAYRVHSESVTAHFVRSGQDVADARRCIEISRSLLPPDRAEAISRQARETISLCALPNAYNDLSKGEYTTAFIRIREALKCSISPRVIKALLLFCVRVPRGGVRRALRVFKAGYATGRN